MAGIEELQSGSLKLDRWHSKMGGADRKNSYVENSNSKHRDKAEIIASILEITASSGATNTKIAYRAFLSYKILQKYLLFMLEKGLIEIREGEKKTTTSFISTDKGRRLLYILNQINEMTGRKNNDYEGYTWC